MERISNEYKEIIGETNNKWEDEIHSMDLRPLMYLAINN